MNADKNLIAPIAAYLLLLIISFGASIIGELGPAESLHDPASIWLYVRRLLMVACAVLLPLTIQKLSISEYGWNKAVSPKWLTVCLLIGIAMGYGNKGGFVPLAVSAVVLACFHTFATELFFRAYLITSFSRAIKSTRLAIIIPAAMYGLFYMTVWEGWRQEGAGKLLIVFLFTTIGIIYGYCYKKSGTVYVPWLMHFLSVLKYKALFE